MSADRLSEIKAKLAQGISGLDREDVAWLLMRVEELEKQNDWLKKELSYVEHQGEVGY
jgi:FtsZ-binding cell division protein ZapB